MIITAWYTRDVAMNSAVHPPTYTVNGLQVCGFESREQLIDYTLAVRRILVAVNAEKVTDASARLRQIVNAHIGYIDGIGVVWALAQKGQPSAVKIPGHELWLDILRRTYTNKTVYLIGGKDRVINDTVVKLRRDFPGIRIVGYRNGYLATEEERAALIEDVSRTKPDVVFVAMGSPKQEYLMEELYARHPALYQGLGGSFDVYTGHVTFQPPRWMATHLTWAYRLARQPNRIRRQARLVPFALRLISGRL